jgi:hypothetical protein
MHTAHRLVPEPHQSDGEYSIQLSLLGAGLSSGWYNLPIAQLVLFSPYEEFCNLRTNLHSSIIRRVSIFNNSVSDSTERNFGFQPRLCTRWEGCFKTSFARGA